MIRSIILILSISFILCGCYSKYERYDTRVLQTTKENTNSYAQFLETKQLLSLKRDKFSTAEWINIISAVSTVNVLMYKHDIINAAEPSSTNVADVDFLWVQISNGFSKAKNVAMNNLEEFTHTDQFKIKYFSKKSEKEDDDLAGLLAKPSEENINKALILISSKLNYIVKILSVIAMGI